MKKTIFLLSLLGMMASCSEQEELDEVVNDSQMTSRAWYSNEFIVNWNETGQILDGFGVAEADCAAEVFSHPMRDEIMDRLFGQNGLDVSILRGEIFPHYSMDPEDKDFETDADLSVRPGDAYFATANNQELKRRGQLWLTKQAREKYGIDKLFFSTWSAPAWMKEGNQVNGDFIASHGYVKPEHYQDYADYLASFAEAYKKAGLDIYAISPVNEPNYEADWNSCKWKEDQLADFIANYMGPTFQHRGVNSEIIFGELAQWSTLVLGAFNLVSSKKYVENVLDANPEVATYAKIAAGHGYNIPYVPYEFPIVEYDKAKQKGVEKVWLTEISTALDKFDGSMKNAIHWAETIHKYLVDAKVNAFCWWTGARYTETNESMLKLTADGYEVPKRYYAYGNYTKFVKPGSQLVNIKRELGLSPLVTLTSFKKDNQLVVVAVNKSLIPTSTTMKLKGAKADGNLDSYLTDNDNSWKKGTVNKKRDGSYQLELPAQSVVTFVGHVR